MSNLSKILIGILGVIIFIIVFELFLSPLYNYEKEKNTTFINVLNSPLGDYIEPFIKEYAKPINDFFIEHNIKKTPELNYQINNSNTSTNYEISNTTEPQTQATISEDTASGTEFSESGTNITSSGETTNTRGSSWEDLNNFINTNINRF
jgi:hypothetical protein